MILGVFLAIGESFADYQKKGQAALIINYHLRNYSKNFDYVYVFSYGDEAFSIFPNVQVMPNRFRIHRYLYALIVSLLYGRVVARCDALRGLQLSGGIPALMAKYIYRKKYVINYGYIYEKFALIEGKLFQSWVYKIIQYRILLNASKVISTTKYLKKILEKQFPQTKIDYIPNGVDTSLFRPVRADKKWDIIFVGRLEKQKNLISLLDAIFLLKVDKIKALFIGAGSQKKELENIVKQLSIQVTFKNSLPHPQLVHYLNAARIFVLPSLIEGQPKILLEAMSCGVLVMASKIPAHQEIIVHNQNGILFQPDAQNLAESIRRLLHNQRMQINLGKNARKLIEKQYSMRELNKKEISLLYTIAYGQ